MNERWLHNPHEIRQLPEKSVVVIGSAPECFAMQKLSGDWFIAGLPEKVHLERLDWHAFPAKLVFVIGRDG